MKSTVRQIRHIVILAAAILLPLMSEAQNKPLKGRVTDSRSKEPLPYTMLRVVNGTTGTQTNLDGDYSLKLATDDGRIAISCMGYRSDTISIRELRKRPNVKLRPLEITLNAVNISEFKKPSSLLKEVVRRIPDNYHCDTAVGTFFFRRYSLTEDSLWLFCEAMADVMRPGYDKQYVQKVSLFDYDPVRIDSVNLAGNHKRYPLSRLLVYDTTMLRRMLGDSNYLKSPFVGLRQTEYNDPTALTDLLQNASALVSRRNSRRLDKHSTLAILDDNGGERYYLVTYVNDNDSTSIVINHSDLAIVHYYSSSRHCDTITFPWPVNRVLGGVIIPYRHQQYDYAKIDGRYTLVLNMNARASRPIPPKEAVIDNHVYRTFRDIVTDHLVEDYYVWVLVDQHPITPHFLDSTIHTTPDTNLYYHDIFGHGDASDSFWQDYNTVPLEARIADKLKAALATQAAN